jgi:hypothetical protein
VGAEGAVAAEVRAALGPAALPAVPHLRAEWVQGAPEAAFRLPGVGARRQAASRPIRLRGHRVGRQVSMSTGEPREGLSRRTPPPFRPAGRLA